MDRSTLELRTPHGTDRAHRGTLARVALAVVLASCTPLGPAGRSDAGRSASLAPPPALAAATAPPAGRISSEIEALAAFGDQVGARLRTAFLQQELGDWTGAETTLNGILFGGGDPGAEASAVARYLRGRGYARSGDRERAEHEWSLALETARDPALRRRLAAEGFAAGAGDAAARRGTPGATPTLLPRGAWRAAAARTGSMRPMGAVERITIHHSATLVHSRAEAAAVGAIRGIQRHHQVENGWGDIGYHFLIDPAGRVWSGRSLQWQGAHAGDSDRNESNLGICLLGNFVASAQGAPPAAQLRALEELTASLCATYRIDPRQVFTHRELKTTDCPGPYIQVAVERLRARLASGALAAGAAPR